MPHTQTTEISPFSSNNQSFILWSVQSYPDSIFSKSNTSAEQTTKNVSLNNKKKHRNKRTKVLVIGVITGFSIAIIALIVALAVYFRPTNSTQTGMTTQSANSHLSRKTSFYDFLDLKDVNKLNSDTVQVTNTPIIYDVGNGGISGDPPCSSHTVVNDPVRNVNAPGMGGACDNGPLFNTSIGGRWIRFVGTGGTLVAQNSPGVNHCGAFLSTWFNGSLPSTIGTMSSGDICAASYIGPLCQFAGNASVVNCGSFYVYFLPPLVLCNSRYCTT